MFNIKIPDEYKLILSQFVNSNLLILIVVDLIFIFFAAIYELPAITERYFIIYDLIVCFLIFLDLLYDYFTSEKSLWEFLFVDKNIITLISIIPLDLLFFRYFIIFRIIRIIGVLRVVRVIHLQDNDSIKFFISNHMFRLLTIIMIIYVVLSALLLLVFDQAFNNFLDGVWFTIITATTVGYGDITPMSAIGKSLSVLTIIMGIIFVSVFTAYLTSIYNEQSDDEIKKYLEEQTKQNKHSNDRLNDEMLELKEQINSLENKLDALNETLEKMEKNNK